MTIKHLILPGGGINGIQTLGVLYKLSQSGYYNVNDIESIYATSISSFLAVLIALKFDWEYINDYVIQRPWHETFSFSVSNLLNLMNAKGLYDHEVFNLFFKPFFDAKEISMDISLTEFFNLTKVDLHFYSLNLNLFQIVDVNKDTFPDLKLMVAVQMTSSLPLLISPILYNNEYYMDGAIGSNYPLKYCAAKEDEILGIYNENEKKEGADKTESSMTIFDYIVFVMSQLIHNTRLKIDDVKGGIQNEITCKTSAFTIDGLLHFIRTQSERQKLFEQGVQAAETFLLSKKNPSETAFVHVE